MKTAGLISGMHSAKLAELMKKLLSVLTVAAACLTFSASGANVGPTGYSTDFSTQPAAADWSTRSVTGGASGAADSTTVAQVDTNIAVIAASSITAQLNSSNANPPNATGLAVWQSSVGYVQTRSTGIRLSLLMATLMNTSGTNANSVAISYNFTSVVPVTEEVPGHVVYYSTNGAAGSWTQIPALTSVAPGAVAATVALSSAWNNGATLYLLWVDDNAAATPDTGQQIDDFSIGIIGSGAAPLFAALTAPANGIIAFTPTNVLLSATASGGTAPVGVSFFTNDVLAATVSTAPYNATLNNLAPGTYRVFARATDSGSGVAFTATNTIVVRNEFVSYTGGIYSETFNSMTVTGTQTPTGWYVGAALPTTAIAVTVGDGAAGANTAILGWNYGTTNGTADSDRALGTAPTGADRNMELRIKNNTASAISSFDIHFDGEVWRNYTNAVDGWLTNFVSFDLGTNWIATGFDFDQPTPRVQPQGAVDGNNALNRTAGIGGTVTPPSPVPPGGVIYIRWQDFNGAGVTDGGLAIDNFTFQAGAQGPRLTIRQTDSTHVEISWPTSADPLALLYFKTDLNSGTWTLETGLDVPSGGFHHVSVSTAGSKKFWTLRK